jgi:hypothetical protein
MTGRALLVGAETRGLNGPDGDVAAMAAGLGRHGFTDLRPHIGAEATRDKSSRRTNATTMYVGSIEFTLAPPAGKTP